MSGKEHPTIDLASPVSFASSFRFPLQSAEARRELLHGAILLAVLPGVGWLLNLGHRIMVVHRMQHGHPPWPAWQDYRQLLRHGVTTFAGMVYYYIPGLIALYCWWTVGSQAFAVLATTLLAGATLAIPGYMSHYCREFDPSEIYNPLKALRRCLQGGSAYWRAWLISLTALCLSFGGLLVLGVGFLVTSVWFWQVAGFSFASVFTQRFALHGSPARARGRTW